MKIKFFPGHSTVKSTSIYLIVRHGKSQKGVKNTIKINTGITGIDPRSRGDWNYNTERLKPSATDSDAHNTRLDEIISAANAVKNAIKPGEKITIVELERRMKAAVNIQITDQDIQHTVDTSLLVRFDQFIEFKKLTKTNSTIQKYKNAKRHLENFATHYRFTLSFDRLDSNFYDNLQVYFIQHLKFSNRTANKNISLIVSFVRWAVNKKYCELSEYKSIEKLEQNLEGDVIFLEENELFELFSADYSHRPAWDAVRDVFCFLCFTGQRFSDVKQMKRDDIKKNIWSINQKKTNTRVQIPLNEFALEILNKYKKLNRPLPIISEQKTNDTIKDICEKLEFEEIVSRSNKYGSEVITDTGKKWEFMSTHIGRKTWITLSLLKGMKLEEVMKISGHRTYASMQPYIKVTEKRKSAAMNDVWNRKNMSVMTAVK